MSEAANDSEPDYDIVFLERTRASYRWERRDIEKSLAAGLGDTGLARWLADPKSGRFLIADYLQVDRDFFYVNADSVKELIEILEERCGSHKQEQREGRNLGLYVSSEVESIIRRHFLGDSKLLC